MRISFARPPLYALINAKFDVEGKPVIFCWGDTIFNPMRLKIPSVLMAHEEVHSERQGKYDPEITAWWHRYLDSPEFRFEEELYAHRAEYRAYRKLHGPGQRTAKYLDIVAEKFSSPLYGSIVPRGIARELLLCDNGLPVHASIAMLQPA